MVGFVVVAGSRNPLNLRCLLAEVNAWFPLMNLFIYDIFVILRNHVSSCIYVAVELLTGKELCAHLPISLPL